MAPRSAFLPALLAMGACSGLPCRLVKGSNRALFSRSLSTFNYGFEHVSHSSGDLLVTYHPGSNLLSFHVSSLLFTTCMKQY